MTIKSRVHQFLNEEGYNKNSFYKEIGISPSNFKGAAILSDLGGDKVAKILTLFPHLNPDWLLNGIGDMYRDNDAHHQGHLIPLTCSKSPERKIAHQTIPFYNINARAGFLSQIADTRQNPDDYIYIPNTPKCDGAIFVSGDSMYPLLKSGDLVGFSIIHDASHIMWGQMYIIDFTISGDDYLAIKWAHRSGLGEDYIKLVSQNEHHAPIDIPRAAIRKIAIVKISIRQHTNI